MPYWDLSPGSERPLSRGEVVGMGGVGNLTPQEAATRAERWFGARVEYANGKIKIYPKDPAQPMVTIADRWSNGSDRRNAVGKLQRAGLDVINGQTPPESVIRTDGRSIDPHLTQKIELPTREDAAPVTTVEPARNGHPTPAAVPAKAPASKSDDYQELLGMLGEAEARDRELQGALDTLVGVVDTLSARVHRLEELEHQNRARYAALSRRIKDAEEHANELVSMMGDPRERAERERAELTDKAVALLESLPPAATMTAGSIAASLGMPEKGNTLGKLLVSAAKEGRVRAVKVGVQNLYRAASGGES